MYVDFAVKVISIPSPEVPAAPPISQYLASLIGLVEVPIPALKSSVVALLQYLSGQGRTNANCWAADLFFGSDDLDHVWSEQELPDDFHDLLAMMGEALHDTVSSPEIAQNFGCLPEQLLKCAERLEI